MTSNVRGKCPEAKMHSFYNLKQIFNHVKGEQFQNMYMCMCRTKFYIVEIYSLKIRSAYLSDLNIIHEKIISYNQFLKPKKITFVRTPI